MTTFNETEHPRAADGKFAEKHRAEDLSVDLAPAGDTDRDALIAEYLGDGPDLTDRDKRMLDILIDPANHEYIGYDPDGLEDTLETLTGHGDDSTFDGAKAVADLLDAHYSRHADITAPGGFRFELNRDSDYGVGSYTVSAYLGTDTNTYLSQSDDSKYLDPTRYIDADASGLRKAIEMASNIDADYQRLLAKARAMGLVPNPDATPAQPDIAAAKEAIAAFEKALEGDSGDAEIEAAYEMRDHLERLIETHEAAARAVPEPVWPTNEHEKAAYDDYKYEVANGDTAVSFRDWYRNRYQDEQVDGA